MLLIGLGNYGDKYKLHRHNVGFILIDAITRLISQSFSSNKGFQGEMVVIKQNEISNERQKIAYSLRHLKQIILFKPHTFVNLSGQAVQSIANFYKIQPEQIIVIHDDLDLAFGQIKAKQGGGSGGHNGLKSIDSAIGKNYNRLRIGISRPENKNQIAEYVVSNFSSSELKIIEIIAKKIADNFDLLLTKNWPQFVNNCGSDR